MIPLTQQELEAMQQQFGGYEKRTLPKERKFIPVRDFSVQFREYSARDVVAFHDDEGGFLYRLTDHTDGVSVADFAGFTPVRSFTDLETAAERMANIYRAASQDNAVRLHKHPLDEGKGHASAFTLYVRSATSASSSGRR